MGGFSASQLARLNAFFLRREDGTLSGTILAENSIPFNRGAAGAFASGAQGAKADTAFSWGDHGAAGYALIGHTHSLSEVTDFDGSDFATAAQGAKADTAFGWGDHSVAGYLTVAPVLKKDRFTGVAGTGVVLTSTPHTGSAVVVFKNNSVLVETTDYSVSGDDVTFVVALIVSDDVTILYSAV